MNTNTNSNPLQVGMITYGLDRAPGGIGRYTQELTRALQEQGMPLTLLHAGRKRQLLKNAVSLPGSRLLPGLLTVGQLEIGWVGRCQKLSLIHDPVGVMPLFLTGTRRIVTIHDVVPYIYPETSTRLDKLIYHYWLPLAVRRLHAIITVSEHSKRDIIRYLPVNAEDVVVIPEAAGSSYRLMNRIDVKPVLSRYGIDFPYILYVGSLESRKNLPRLLEAFARVQTQHPDWKLVIVGARKWKFTSIFKTVQRVGLDSFVHFTGYVEEEHLPAIYNGADLFVFPSLYEGFGLPVLEAMATGTPVITSNCSSLPEVAGDAAILIDPYDIQAIADAIQQVLSNPTLAASLRVKGLARSKTFSWQRTAKETIAVYERVCGRGTALTPPSPPRLAIAGGVPIMGERESGERERGRG